MENSSSVEGRVGYELKKAQYGLRSRMDEELRGVGLTTPQYAALSALGEEPGASGAGLARRCFVTPQTMNGILTTWSRPAQSGGSRTRITAGCCGHT